jgi:hypothetical protein
MDVCKNHDLQLVIKTYECVMDGFEPLMPNCDMLGKSFDKSGVFACIWCESSLNVCGSNQLKEENVGF